MVAGFIRKWLGSSGSRTVTWPATKSPWSSMASTRPALVNFLLSASVISVSPFVALHGSCRARATLLAFRSAAAKPGSKMYRAATLLSAVLACLSLAEPALAQPRTLAEIAAYQGADRMERLIEGAKREGTLTLYTSRVAEDTTPVTDAFTKKYGVDVQVWRASNRAVLQRVVQERRAGRCAADVVSSGTPALEPLHREQVLQAIKSPTYRDLMPQALRPHGDWVGISVNIISAAYNTNLVRAAEVPKSYDEIKDPRWKGRLAIEADDVDWFAAVVGKLGEEAGLKLFRDIVRNNGVSVRTGHTLLANMVAAGEVPLALTVYSYKPEQLARAGAPIRALYLPPVVALATGVSVTRCATHPNAAVLFYEFMLRDGQEILAKRDIVPTNLAVKPLPAGLEITLMDPLEMLDNGAKWTELWQKTVIRPQ
jgi:iron(III) transport system substrate-binding protein